MSITKARWLSRGLAAFSLLGPLSQSAQGQDRFNVEAFEPAPAVEGSVLNVYGARTFEKGTYALSLMGSYGRKPLSVESSSGSQLSVLAGSVSTLQLLGAIGVTKHFDVGIGLPLHRIGSGSEYDVAPPAAVSAATVGSSRVAMGDIRLVPRVSLYEHSGNAGFDVALLAPLYLPTGNDSVYAGESFRIEPRVAVDYTHKRLLVAFNAGYLVRKKAQLLGSQIDDQVRLGLGAEVPLIDALSLMAEANSSLNVLASDFDKKAVTTEVLGGLRGRKSGFIAQLGGGAGVMRALGAPTYRLFASIGYMGALPRDRDGDGVLDTRDACPEQAEDRDGFQDDDGCPELDNDADGIADTADQCPGQPEDLDGFEDTDGCPDGDNDRDGVPDGLDQCAMQPGVEALHGCPEPEKPALVRVTDEKIELTQKVQFGNNSAKIEDESNALLDSIAQLLSSHPEITLVVVEGHSDDRGQAARNQQLSADRAKAVVDALVQRGVVASRLKSEGFGSTRPRVPNDTDENRAANRRVELRIEKRGQ